MMRLNGIGVLGRATAAALAAALFTGQAAAQPVRPEAPKAGAAPTPAAAPTLSETLSGMAKAEYESAKVLYADKDYANAIVKFRRAYELSNDPRLLWNIAVCEKNLRRYTKMLASLRKYREDGGPLLTEQDRKDAAELTKAVEPFVSPLDLTTSVPGAAVFVDDEKVGTTPLGAPVMVDVGARKIRVVKPGFKEIVRSEEVVGGSALVLSVKLEKEIHQGRLTIVAGAKDLIAIDGKAVAQGRWEGKLASGGHTLRVTAPGMVAQQTEVLVQDDKSRQIQVTLNPVPKAGDTTWVWIAGGAALTAGAVIGGAFLFQNDAKVEQGTLGTFPTSFSFGGKR
jgi:hypothetical protein